ncbi:MAG: aminoacyl-tRNA hydrolase [Lentisphaeria bacterium]|nr:aminoacyl-tRNA hydrolase [Lentisphaeria bacterium]
MVLVAGLGNPGREYENTRHNIGFMVIDKVLEKLNGASVSENGCNSIFYKLKYKGKSVIFAKPQTFMNLSGNAVAALMNREKLDKSNLLVVHDELDLPLGRMRIRKGGSSGGHNGINSIIEMLGNQQDFLRMRIGIGRDRNVVDYVLGEFKEEEKGLLNEMIDCAADAVIELLKAPASVVMNRCNALDLSESTKNNE